MSDETLLGVINGKSEDEIIEVVLIKDSDGNEKLRVRNCHWGAGIGWYTLKSLDIDPGQVDRLVGALEKGRTSTNVVRSAEFNRGVVVPFLRKYGT